MDDADVASRDSEQFEKAQADFIKAKAAEIPKGNPGYCDECGEHNGRLVGGICSPCRDILIKLGVIRC